MCRTEWRVSRFLQNRLNYLAGAVDDELREITHRNVEYRAVDGMARLGVVYLLSSSGASVISGRQGLRSKKMIYPGPECVRVRTDFSEKGGLG
jgi:hypothetical protein